ncbi:hypothetical protein NN561_004736 [Cricetulus griseus]
MGSDLNVSSAPRPSLTPSFLKSLGSESPCCALSRDSSTQPPPCLRGSLTHPLPRAPVVSGACVAPRLPAPPALSAGRADEAACQLLAPRGLASSSCCFFSPPPILPWPGAASCGAVRSAASAAGSQEEPGPGLGHSCTPAPAGHLQRPGPRPRPLGRPRLPEPRGHTPSRSAPPPIPSSVPCDPC